MIPIKYKDIHRVKEELLEKQNYKCPVSGVDLVMNKESVVDHQHRLFKNQPLGEDGAGLIRGVLQYQVNAWEGKVFNAFRRLGLHKFETSLPNMLINLGIYLERYGTDYIHPSELPKDKRLNKLTFNKINKLYVEQYPRRKKLKYPKSCKATKKIKELAEQYNIVL